VWEASFTDRGDISSVMPAIHPYVAGASGITHGKDYRITRAEACVESALVQLRTAERLLRDGAAQAQEILRGAHTVFPTIQDDVRYKESLTCRQSSVSYREDGIYLTP